MTALDRLVSKIQQDENGCWLWTGYIDKAGYGRLYFNGAARLAHRVSYVLFVGPIPEGLDLDHLCRVRNCVNPDHLDPVTRRENLMRGDTLYAANAAKTECPQRHPYDEQNTAYTRKGQRRCRACKRDRRRRDRAKAMAS